ncbi:antitoxin Xre/MbcA/ParS toxin-binding domain-containing protein [Falsiroseomonas sp. HC035]|uniref:antitoxin Xre/MbcA/ParS toxin-binding domain-containing protein n=1 Tax=Falsiroseomonas sp. HC035 TaxID=3390999 RepID=UPI003D31877A
MEAAIADVIRVLGVTPSAGRSADPLRFARQLQDGLPIRALLRLAEALAPGDMQTLYAFVPKATLARRQKTKRLSAEESAKLARVAGVYAVARDVWGSDDEARDFLQRRHPLLDDDTPLSVALGSDVGARLVERILGRLRHGTAA